MQRDLKRPPSMRTGSWVDASFEVRPNWIRRLRPMTTFFLRCTSCARSRPQQLRPFNLRETLVRVLELSDHLPLSLVQSRVVHRDGDLAGEGRQQALTSSAVQVPLVGNGTTDPKRGEGSLLPSQWSLTEPDRLLRVSGRFGQGGDSTRSSQADPGREGTGNGALCTHRSVTLGGSPWGRTARTSR